MKKTKMKKIMIIQLLLLCSIGTAFCQNRQRFLVFTFNSVYTIGQYKHGTGDNLWIIPYDSCKTNLSEKLMVPLFADNDLIECLSDSIVNNQSFGYFPTTDYTSNDNVRRLLKYRKRIQFRTTLFSYQKSKEELSVYIVPIIANCSAHKFGYYNEPIMTIDGELEIWNDFWINTDKRILQLILNHDFSKFDYRVCISKKE